MENQKKESERKILRSCVHLVLAALFVSFFFYFAGPLYIRIFLPLFSLEIETLHPEYEVKKIYLNPKKQIMYDVTVYRKSVDAQGRILQEVPLRGGVIGKTMYICPIIIYTLLLGWPGLSLKQRLKSLLLSIPLLIAVQLIDVPIHLINRIQMPWPVDSPTEKFRVFWVYVINNGGRQFLAIIVAILSIASVRMVFPRAAQYDKLPIGRNDPCPCGSGKKYKKCCGQ